MYKNKNETGKKELGTLAGINVTCSCLPRIYKLLKLKNVDVGFNCEDSSEHNSAEKSNTQRKIFYFSLNPGDYKSASKRHFTYIYMLLKSSCITWKSAEYRLSTVGIRYVQKCHSNQRSFWAHDKFAQLITNRSKHTESTQIHFQLPAF